MGWLVAIGVGTYLYLRYRAAVQDVAAGDSPPSGPSALACAETRLDGPWTICLIRREQGWAWSADRPTAPGIVVVSLADYQVPHSGMDSALAAAWQRLATEPVADVIMSPIERHGVTMATNGFVTLSDVAAWVNFASGRLEAEREAGHSPIAQIVRVLQQAFGENWNPLRIRIDRWNFVCASDPAQCTLQAAAQRMANAGDNPVVRARAVFGVT